MSNWIFDMLKRNKVNKTASDTDKDTEWQKKINSSEWIKNLMSLTGEDEAETPEVEKEAAYEMGDTEEETLKNDYDRDVHALSDYALAEMLAEYTWQGKGVPENYSEAKEDMKSKVSKNRGSAEKDLLKLVGEHTKIDWKKTFEKYSDYEHKPAEAKDLYKPEFKPEGKQNWDKKVDYKSPSDSERTKGMEGVGRNEKERTDVTKQASKKEADCGSCGVPAPKKESAAVTEEAQNFISQHIEKHIKEDGMKQDQAAAAAYSEARAKGYDVPENPKAGSLDKKARRPYFEDFSPEMQQQIVDAVAVHLKTSDMEEVDNFININNDGDSLMAIINEDFKSLGTMYIENKSDRASVLKKIAEIESPWKVIKDAEGQDVIARVSSD